MGTITRGEFRAHLRDVLGEQREGFWKNPSLNRYIQRAIDEHAKQAWSVQAEMRTTSLPGVSEYDFSSNFGEPIAVRFASSVSQEAEHLDYEERDVVLELQSGSQSQAGEPELYYRFQDTVGLWPAPNKPPIFQRTFQRRCERYVNIYNVGSSLLYRRNLTFKIEPRNMDTPLVELDICRVYCSHVSVFLRREALPYPGFIMMTFQPVNTYEISSYPLSASKIKPFGEWNHFDFTRNPIEITTEETTFEFALFGDPNYRSATPASREGEGVQIAVEGDYDEPYIQLHQQRNDIEIDFFKNKCNVLESDDDVIEVPDRYFQTCLDLATSYATAQRRRDLAWSRELRAEAKEQMMKDKNQAQIKTHGRRRPRNRKHIGTGPYMYYRNGKLVGRAW